MCAYTTMTTRITFIREDALPSALGDLRKPPWVMHPGKVPESLKTMLRSIHAKRRDLKLPDLSAEFPAPPRT